ncbi:DUF1223 domain-containing protein [Nioella sediminis]|jgi:hypothetical protein|uniref:DUF1223 domain-containing protein n=1 Tax=Nioella sediminis TaxID=1912092 RepID=UPI0008FD1584|nr:DUF1223 domain-containing protein [Nioella sediminis]TBX27790.1 hypothetical protein TK43_09120 [Roseovarius sp. JS7-11]
MRKLIASLALGLLSLTAPAARADSPVVVELFTSQGCSACPPADALLTQLAEREDVIALALHVDYWDYIGWADTFASGQFTRRQHAYARHAGQRMVYTPQMIVGGVERVVGYEPMDVAELIAQYRVVDYPVEVSLSRVEGGIVLRAVASMALEEPGMIVQIVRYMPSEMVEIRRGENAGRTVEYSNIVTEWMRVGDWSGAEPYELQLVDDSALPIAAIVQMAGPGQILGAARLD